MASASRGKGNRAQINVPLVDEHWHIALLQLSIRDGKSVPELLRPVIIGYLKRKLDADASLAAAVEHIERSRQTAQQARRGKVAPVTEIPQRGNQRRRRSASRAADNSTPK